MRSIYEQSRLLPAFAALLGLVLATGCGEGHDHPAEAPGAAHSHEHVHGPNGGTVVEVGDAGHSHLEFKHLAMAGRIEMYFTKDDGKTPVPIKDPVCLNLKVKGEPIQVQAASVAGKPGAFTGEHAAFKGSHLHGQIVFTLGGKEFYQAFPEACTDETEGEHQHGPDCDHEHGEELKVIPGAAGDHEHGEDCDHDHGDEHAHHESAISTTQWTGKHEWFVELAAPENGAELGFAAHLTTLADFKPVGAGSLSVVATMGDQKVTAAAPVPARPGIFTPKITFPASGDWTLQLTYQQGGESCGITWMVKVLEHGDLHSEGQDANHDCAKGISFLKEKQWKIPFATQTVGQDLVVPAVAVITDQGKSFVFVQQRGESFEKRELQTDPASNGNCKVKAGLKAGEHIVIKGMEQLNK